MRFSFLRRWGEYSGRGQQPPHAEGGGSHLLPELAGAAALHMTPRRSEGQEATPAATTRLPLLATRAVSYGGPIDHIRVCGCVPVCFTGVVLPAPTCCRRSS
jgi:hypothetical protein